MNDTSPQHSPRRSVAIIGGGLAGLAAAAKLCERDVRVELFEGPAGFDDAVSRADLVTPAGGVILLSPGAPSFGRFRDYRERGMHFRTLLGFDPVAP